MPIAAFLQALRGAMEEMTLEPEQVDLALLARHVATRFRGDPAVGYVVGRTRIRDAVAEHLRCSALEAEQLVDTMVQRGFFQFQAPPGTAGQWVISGSEN